MADWENFGGPNDPYKAPQSATPVSAAPATPAAPAWESFGSEGDTPGLVDRLANAAARGLAGTTDLITKGADLVNPVSTLGIPSALGLKPLPSFSETNVNNTSSYDPQSTLEKYGQSIAEAIGGNAVPAALSMGVAPAGQVLRTALTELGASAAQGVGGQAGEEVGGDTGRLVGELVGGGLGAVATHHLQNLFDQGASADVLKKAAADLGTGLNEDELQKAIKYRDEGGKGAKIVPAEPTPQEPSPAPVEGATAPAKTPATPAAEATPSPSSEAPAAPEGVPDNVPLNVPEGTETNVNLKPPPVFGTDEELVNLTPGREDQIQPVRTYTTDEVKQLLEQKGVPSPEEINSGVRQPTEEATTTPVGGVEPSVTPPTPTPDETIAKLTDAIRNHQQLQIDQADVNRLTTRDRVKAMAQAKATAQALGLSEAEGRRMELAALRGKFARVTTNPLSDQFSQDELEGLFNHLWDNPNLKDFESLRARRALTKILQGEVPTPSELKPLAKVYPPEFIKEAIDNPEAVKSIHGENGAGVGYNGGPSLDAEDRPGIYKVANDLSRAVMASTDISAPFRQGRGLIHRKEWYTSFAKMFQVLGSKKAYRALEDTIASNPDFELLQKAKVDLPGITSSRHEEGFESKLIGSVPFAGKLVAGSERAYNGFLNKLRADTFYSLVNEARAAGRDLTDEHLVKSLGEFINTATGRGSLGALEKHANALSDVFFAPKYLAAQAQQLNPAYYIRLDPFARRQAIKSFIAQGAFIGGALGIAKAAGLDVGLDPRSSDFMKIKNGNRHYDVGTGNAQIIRLAAQLAFNEKTVNGQTRELGKKFGDDTRLTVLSRFARTKLAPIPGLIADYFDGKNVVGEPFKTSKEVMNLFEPMFIQDTIDAYNDTGVTGALSALPGGVGFGVMTYTPHQPKYKSSYQGADWESFK